MQVWGLRKGETRRGYPEKSLSLGSVRVAQGSVGLRARDVQSLSTTLEIKPGLESAACIFLLLL